ncbi:hypothetical protein CPT_Sycamore_059 [Streptomyces phage Sycamore]|uniref:Uncharacterized protein n=1 Tax=Streptomyces phage Sycamore TaxID=2767589 RepID=A0A873WDQ8_9CAUD|nr:hypothetical protein CPT_Sycamore_059 [Streptomyces phage Sycamore]
MTMAPERPTQAAPAPVAVSSYCGQCIGHGWIWCNGCCGFSGCVLCGFTFKRPCPVCVGGDAEPIPW